MRDSNIQPTKELSQFQKLIVQDLYIKQLNKWLDELDWENEKKDALVEMKEKEIADLKEKLITQKNKITKVESEFHEYIKKVKSAKIDIDKHKAQQDVIDKLKHELQSCESRLKTSHRMNELLAKQNKNGR